MTTRLDNLLTRVQQNDGQIQLSEQGQLQSDGKATISKTEAAAIAKELDADGYTPKEKQKLQALLKGAAFEEGAKAVLQNYETKPTVSRHQTTLDAATENAKIFDPAHANIFRPPDPAKAGERAAKAIELAESVLADPKASAEDKATAYRSIAYISSSASYLGVSVPGQSANQLAAKGANALRGYIGLVTADGLDKGELDMLVSVIMNDKLLDPAEHAVAKELIGKAGDLSDTKSFEALATALERVDKEPLGKQTVNPEDLKKLGQLNYRMITEMQSRELTGEQKAAVAMELMPEIGKLGQDQPLEMTLLVMDTLDTLNYEMLFSHATLEAYAKADGKLTTEEVKQWCQNWRCFYLTHLTSKAPPNHPSMRPWFDGLLSVTRRAGGEARILANTRLPSTQQVLEKWEAFNDKDPNVYDYRKIMARYEGSEDQTRVADKIGQAIRANPGALRRDSYLDLVSFYKFDFKGKRGAERAENLLKFFNAQPNDVRRGREVKLDEIQKGTRLSELK